jgi:hypothetical protein
MTAEMQGDTTGQVHKGGHVNVPNQVACQIIQVRFERILPENVQ